MTKLIEKFSLWTAPAFLALLTLFLLWQGGDKLTLDFFIEDPERLGREGGIRSILGNTLMIVGSAMAIATPVSLSAALWYAMTEPQEGQADGTTRKGLRTLMEVGLCLPRLLWGLAGATVFGSVLGLGFSAAAGVLTLAVLLMPILITSFIDGLQQVGRIYVPACNALGMTRATTWFLYVMPQARPTILTAILLSTGRALGDAAALVLTAGVGMRLLGSLDQSGATLAVHIYNLAVEIGGGQSTAFAASAVLLGLTLLIQSLVIFFGKTDQKEKDK